MWMPPRGKFWPGINWTGFSPIARGTDWAWKFTRIPGWHAAKQRGSDPDKPDALLDPDAIALSYLNILHQPRSAWTWEIELRPWVERF